ncbi:MAG: ARMT1-like domain-containing protein [Thermoproteota archaeon]
MKPGLLCIPCTVNAAYDMVSKATSDEEVTRKILFDTLEWLQKAIKEETSPNILHTQVYRTVQRSTGVTDPFKILKEASNNAALRIYPSIRNLAEAENPMEALRLCLKAAIVGNMMDFEVHGHRFSLENLFLQFKNYLNEPLAVDDVDKLCKEIEKGKNILYLTDNAGEIVFDKLVATCLRNRWRCRVTMVVKERPVLNDATREDAEQIRLDEACDRVITTGDDTIGIVMTKVSEEFKQALSEADIVISKGQGNLESLTGFEKNIGRPVCYVLRVKCEVIAKHLGVPSGSNVVRMVGLRHF